MKCYLFRKCTDLYEFIYNDQNKKKKIRKVELRKIKN